MFGFKKCKDGGPESKVWFYGWEFKKLFSIALLKFEPGSREAYHSHAFNCISLILGPGYLREEFKETPYARYHHRGDILITTRTDYHKVISHGRTWVLTLRGPWKDTWKESVGSDEYSLTHGRKHVAN